MAATAVLFDLDGTVWDSFPFYAGALSRGDPASHTAALVELRAASPAAALLKSAGFTPARFRAYCESCEPVGLFHGARRCLRRLADRGTPLGAVTNLPAWMVEPMLASHGLGETFGSLVTAGRARPSKPHPAPLRLCCQELDVAPAEDCWYVGDSPADARAALTAGLSFAWAAWGYGDSAPAGTNVTLRRFSDVLEL